MALRILKSGTWLYDASVAMPVDVIGLDYDFWYEMTKADGLLDPGEDPESLSPDGFLYYVRFQRAGQISEPTWVESGGRNTIEAAMIDAQGKVQSPISWDKASPAI